MKTFGSLFKLKILSSVNPHFFPLFSIKNQKKYFVFLTFILIIDKREFQFFRYAWVAE